MNEQDIVDITPKVENFIKDLVDRSSLDLRVDFSHPEPGSIQIEFRGFDLPLLLGHSAELLDAFQYISRRAFADAVANGLQLDFDANGYRKSRHQELELMALKAAEKVKLTKTSFVFDPMNAQDRRIVHMALVDIEGIRTESEGEGQMRRVKVVAI